MKIVTNLAYNALTSRLYHATNIISRVLVESQHFFDRFTPIITILQSFIPNDLDDWNLLSCVETT
jgi:hypothetical protein